MGILTDTIKELAPIDATPARDTLPDIAAKGLRSGTLSAGSQLSNLGGAVADALGADALSRGAYETADSLRDQAAQAAPAITSYKQVRGLRDAADYATGLLGQSAPVLGATLGATVLTGGAALPAIAAGTAVAAPLEMGDVVARQREAGQEVSLRDAAVLGGASALAQGVVPGLAGAKVLGKAATRGAMRELGQIPADAALGAVGEGVKQQAVTPGQLDGDALAEAAVGNAVGAAPLAGVSALKGAGGKAPRARQEALGAPEPAPEVLAAEPVPDKGFRGLLAGARRGPDEDALRLAGGAPLGDLQAIAKASTEELPRLLQESDSRAQAKAAEWVHELAADPELTPDQRNALVVASKDLSSDDNLRTVAGLKKVRDLGRRAVGDISRLWGHLSKKLGGNEAGAQRSEDFSGIRKTILDTVAPLVKEKRPELLENTDATNKLADSLRKVVETATRDGQLDDTTIGHLRNVFGDDVRTVLEEIHGAVADSDPTKTAKFFGMLNQIADNENQRRTTREIVEQGLKGKRSPEEVDALVDNIGRFVRGEYTRGRTPAETEYRNRQFNDAMRTEFGDKTESVLEAFKPKNREVQGLDAEYSQALTETGALAVGVGKKAVPSPQAHRAQFDNESAAERMIREAEAKDPGVKARFVSAKEYAELTGKDPGSVPEGHGFVIAERLDPAARLTSRELSAMKFDSSKGDRAKDPSVIDAGEGVLLDARKMAKVAEATLPYNESDQKGRMHRVARAFMDAVASAQDHLGRKFEVPDTTVVMKRGNHEVTFGELKKLDMAPEGGRDFGTELETLRDDYRTAKGKGDTKAMKAVADRAQKVLDARDAQIGGDGERPSTSAEDFLQAQGKDEADPENDQIHLAAATLGEEKIARKVQPPSNQASAEGTRGAIDSAINRLENGNSRAQRALGEKARAVFKSFDKLSAFDKAALTSIVKGKASDVAEIINGLYAKVGSRAEPPAGKTDQQGLPARPNLDAMLAAEDYSRLDSRAKVDAFRKQAERRMKELQAEEKRVTYDDDHPTNQLPEQQAKALSTLERMFQDPTFDWDSMYDGLPEGSPDPKAVAAKKAAFLERARSGDADLIREVSASNDAKGLQRAAEALRDGSAPKVLDAINERLSTLVQDPDVAYSMQRTGAYETPDAQRGDVEAHIAKVLGSKVKVEWANIFHAGEFERVNGQDVIRLSVHSLNPMSVAYHESLHGFFAKLDDRGEGSVRAVLHKAADSAHVRDQLRTLLAGEPEALRQLADADERVAYMYQFWASGDLKVAPAARTMLGKVAEFFRRALGIWSNDERALRIMEAFHEGEVAKAPGATLRALMEGGRNPALQKARELTDPIVRLADEVAGVGHARLRDTGIPALRELADAVKLSTVGEGRDPGFIPAAREARTATMNRLGAAMAGLDKSDVAAALEALQTGAKAATPEARRGQLAVRKVLDDMFTMMRDAGVKVNDLGMGKDYFPRVYDIDYIGRNAEAFTAVLEKHGVGAADAQKLLRKLLASEGNEFTIERGQPGMQFLKERVLRDIPAEALAPFMQKDLFQIMSSYVTQATRRAEWARRFGDDSSKLDALLTRAAGEGATAEQLNLAKRYMLAVDGTLGDGMDPKWRRLQGNLIVYQNIRLLPLAIFSSVVDPVGISVRGGSLGDSWGAFKRGIREIPKSFKSDGSKDAATELAETLGVIDDAALRHTLGDLYTQGMVGGTARKINDAFFRFNLMEQFNRSMRVGATEAALRFIAKHADGKASVHSARWMAELGLEPSDVKMVDGRPALSEAEGLSEEQALRMRAAVNRWVDGAVLRPDAADKPIWMNDPHWALVAHLKQFVFSFHETILKRIVHEYRHGNYAPVMALASYVPIMIASDAAKGLIQGGGEQPDWKDDWGPGDYLWSGVQRGGLLGVGQFAVDAGTHAGSLTGPAAEQLVEAVKVAGGLERFSQFALKSMPANALYAGAVD